MAAGLTAAVIRRSIRMRHEVAMTRLLPFALAAALAFAPASAQPGTYRAVGTEPFWTLTIAGGTMTFEEAGGRRVRVATPQVEWPRFNGRSYWTNALSVTIHVRRCSDGMSDRVYPDQVTVYVGSRGYVGCGEAFVEPVNFTNTHWRITAVDGRTAPADGPYRLDFTDTRLSGRAGCNSFGGSYRLDGDRLTAGPLIATRMACLGGDAMRNEAAALRILRGPVTVHQLSDETLELRAAAGVLSLRMVPGARPRR